MFDALKGFKEALAAKERQPEPRRELAQDAIEELNRTICTLQPGDMVTMICYCSYGEEYRQITGSITKIDTLMGCFQIETLRVNCSDIVKIVVHS
jgi:hypothetical protein